MADLKLLVFDEVINVLLKYCEVRKEGALADE
jgi:hypothetical protein